MQRRANRACSGLTLPSGRLSLPWLWLPLLAVACARPPSAPGPAAAVTAAVPTERDEEASRIEAHDPGETFQLPARLGGQVPLAEPPELPARLAAAPELTLELASVVEDGAHGATRRKLISRGAHRILVRSIDDGVEWLFIQNPLDPRRVSARRVDHRTREIVEYGESELRLSRVARGWADVASLGVAAERLTTLQPTGRRLQRWGFEFVELRSDAPGADPPLWWSDAAAIPLHLAGDSPLSLADVRGLRRGVDEALLVDPRERYAGYREIDVADAREAHSDHVAGGALR
jgi:hypothetical protein